ncbi:MAG TPA: hypothetical protein VNC61_17775 [Acidimicrobiales bacterium]|nr:hypothetical protein [Acidimicrobiales bacterium]
MSVEPERLTAADAAKLFAVLIELERAPRALVSLTECVSDHSRHS